ncbi:P-loop NTPase fold protein [Streptomyces sp. SM13]|uniref:P-loop NTPase fold protein n=1 Tax=Streptomyces sp. SM13 TaxID=1983803 RepID=UPI000CD542E9|nr:P-loop NTPase fold protein [Streptomyces sp. SM13]
MWSDNETDLDLLGFDFLVDELVVALTQPQLLPLTVGVLGSWGSGKSSLLRIVAAELDQMSDPDSGIYVVVPFSPWQYEGYEDIKTALMESVLTLLGGLVDEASPEAEEVGRLRRMVDRLRQPARRLGQAALSVAPAGVAVAASFADPALGEMASSFTQQALIGATSDSSDDTAPSQGQAEQLYEDVGTFRQRFSELLASLPQVAAVIVMIDDLDRCLPPTVVGTFEAIRLFLNVEKSAFVIAAHAEVVQAAIDMRYPGLGRPGAAGLGAEYLEKMLQVKVNIPALSAPEAETYMHLLLAQSHLDEASFAQIKDAVAQRRRQSALAVALNAGLAAQTLGHQMPERLRSDMSWAAQTAPVLGSGLRGNPRQIKRFMNTLTLRLASAERRETVLSPKVLAKLMVLEEQHLSDFQKLFDWQVQGSGPVNRLADAERRAQPSLQAPAADTEQPDGRLLEPPRNTGGRRGSSQRRDATPPATSAPDGSGGEVEEEVRAWADKPHIAAWLLLDPPLADEDLGPYFTFARARLTLAASTARLPAQLQELLGRLQSDVRAQRRAAVASVSGSVSEHDLPVLVDHLVQTVLRDPGGPAMDGALELAEAVPAAVPAVCDALRLIPLDTLRPKLSSIVRRLPGDDATVAALLDGWQNSAHPISRLIADLRRRGAGD